MNLHDNPERLADRIDPDSFSHKLVPLGLAARLISARVYAGDSVCTPERLTGIHNIAVPNGSVAEVVRLLGSVAKAQTSRVPPSPNNSSARKRGAQIFAAGTVMGTAALSWH